MQTRLVVVRIDILPVSIAPFLEVILLLGTAKSIMLLPVAIATYQAMAHTASKVLWVRSLLPNLGIDNPTPFRGSLSLYLLFID